MSDIAIRVKNLSKSYQIYAKPRDRLKQFIFPLAGRLFGRKSKQYFSEFWALKNVSFEIRKGETVGIVGRNGSGKSTLLQMICGTLTPTAGEIQTQGRVAALLELGAGFNPEFTGKENVYMNAAVLGLQKEEIDERYDDILNFAEIGDFIEQPVKTYSSGMVVRLAFAVAINVDPEILIVDEALSVGDELFQRKCFSRIEAIKAGGATILFVSHSGGIIVELCDRAVLLDAGEQLAIGTPKFIVGRYQKLLYAPADKFELTRQHIMLSGEVEAVESAEDSLKNTSTQPIVVCNERQVNFEPKESYDENLIPSSTLIYESHGAIIDNPQIFTLSGDRVNNLIRGETYRYTYRVQFSSYATNVRFGMLIKTMSGLELGGGASAKSAKDSLPFVSAHSVFQIEFRFCCSLNPGVYFLNAGIVGSVNGSETYLHRITDLAMFRVLPVSDDLATGIIDFLCYPTIDQKK